MEKLKGIKGAIFDLDGTLLDSMSVWEDIDKAFLAARGIVMPADYVEAINPLGFRAAAAYTIDRFGLQETVEALIKEWHERSVFAYGHDIKLKPYARELLLQLKAAGVKLGVATALDAGLFVPVLKNNGVYDLFAVFTSLSEVKRGKGHPDIYLKAAETMGLKPPECAVFEDIYLGIKGANDGGFLSVGVYDRFSYFEAEKIKNTADIYLNGFGELMT